MQIESKKRNIAVMVITSLSIVIFIVLFIGTALKTRTKMMSTYYSAIEKISEENYQEAINLLNELGDYKDSLDLIKKARILEYSEAIYNDAVKLFNNENYEDAVELFEQIADYKNSKEYIDKANFIINQEEINASLYSEAIKYYNDSNYILAIQKFTELNEYKDSEEMLQNCRLELARLQQATTISAGIRSSVGMIKDKKVYLAGDDKYSWEDELENWNNIISISIKGNFVVGLKEDGTVIMAGETPKYYVGTKTWSDVIAVSTGQQYIVGLRSDGTLVAQGHNGDHQVDIDDWANIVDIATGWRHTVGLDSNGEIHITGFQSDKQLKQINEHKEDWSNIVAIDAGGGTSWEQGTTAYTIALKQDGTVVTTLTGEIADKISEWTDIIAVSAGDSHIVALKSDKTVVTTQIGQSADEISKWENIVAISAGYGFTLGLKGDGTIEATGYRDNGQIDVDLWKAITNYEDEWKSIFDDDLRWNGIK